ncbi:MAG: hypothetical protein JWN62_4107, partial [Acidimicrobiales bacterium]|nr:hypothetical protein [Acidimicrobiales bacterium]
ADGARLASVAASLTPEQFDRFLRHEIARLDERSAPRRDDFAAAATSASGNIDGHSSAKPFNRRVNCA